MNKVKTKIFFVLPTLYAGGAERIMSFVAQNLDKTKFDVTLVVIGREKDSKYEVKGIKVKYLNKRRVLHGIPGLIKLIIWNRPKIIVSSIAHLNITMGFISVFLRRPIYIGRQAGVPGALNQFNNKQNTRFFDFENFALNQLDHFICQSEDMKIHLMKLRRINENSITILNNPITQTEIVKKEKTKNKKVQYITIGRLSKAKGFSRIINNLSKLNFPFHYTIIGEGAYRETILKQLGELNLTDKVTLINYTDQIPKFLVSSDYFLQGSYSEGFPNALLESCSVGTPVIAFNAPGGTKEIVENNINGFLVKDENEFLQKLKMEKDWDPQEVRDSVFKKFNKEKILSEYEKLFHSLIN